MHWSLVCGRKNHGQMNLCNLRLHADPDIKGSCVVCNVGETKNCHEKQQQLELTVLK